MTLVRVELPNIKLLNLRYLQQITTSSLVLSTTSRSTNPLFTFSFTFNSVITVSGLDSLTESITSSNIQVSLGMDHSKSMDDAVFEEFHMSIMKEFFHQNINEEITDESTIHNETSTLKALDGTILQDDDLVITVPIFSKTYLKAFECDKCATVLSSQTNLSRHMRQVHQGERPFQCDLCFKTFTQKSNLKRHQSRHFKQDNKQISKQQIKLHHHPEHLPEILQEEQIAKHFQCDF